MTGTKTLGYACCLTYLGIYLEETENPISATIYFAEARALYMHIGEDALRMETRAEEARCLLALKRTEKAQGLATEVWAYVRDPGTENMDFPSRVYTCVADVFAAVETPPVSARVVVQSGYRDLMNRAETISDPNWRPSFLENVVENKELIERWKILNNGDVGSNQESGQLLKTS